MLPLTGENEIILRLGKEFRVDDFRLILDRYYEMIQGFPKSQNKDEIRIKVDWFYNYFHAFKTLIQEDGRDFSSLDDLRFAIDKKFYPVLDNIELIEQNSVLVLPELKVLSNKATDVLEDYIQHVGAYLVDLSANPFPVNLYLPNIIWSKWEREIIPGSVISDWEQALACFNVNMFTAGCMMAYRAAETMLIYFYENVTGRPHLSDQNWGRMENLLKDNELGILGDIERDELTEALERAREFRNTFAHGQIKQHIVTWEDARYFTGFASKVITECVNRLIEKGKTWRILIPKKPEFQYAVVYALLDMFGGGIIPEPNLVNEITFEKAKQSDLWNVHFREIDNIDPNHLFGQLQKGIVPQKMRHLNSKRRGIERLLTHINTPDQFQTDLLRKWISTQFENKGFDNDQLTKSVFKHLCATAKYIINHNVNITEEYMSEIKNFIMVNIYD